ncbi:MAG: hypothetical protein ACRD0G_05995 [Acidimicrobiales bacterium]
MADVAVAPNSTVADSGGTPRTQADAANLDAALLEQLDLSDLLSRVHDEAPPDDGPSEDELLGLPVPPLLNASVANVFAQARWAGDNRCIDANTPLAESDSAVADLSLLELPTGGDVADLGPGAAHSSTEINLPAIPDPDFDRRAVEAVATTDLAELNLLGGEVQVRVASPPVLTATVTGLDGGASVDYTTPLVQVTIAGGDPIELDPSGSPLDITLPSNPLIGLSLRLGQPEGIVEAADGTTAAGTVSLLSLDLTVGAADPLPPIVEASLDIAPLAAAASVSRGGLICGELPEIRKDVSASVVAPGGTFTYSVLVNNIRPDCTVTDVVLTDVVVGPAGTTIAGVEPAEPPATITPEENGARHTLVWDIGELAPLESRTFHITVQVPADAQANQTYSDFATFSGTCNGAPFERPGEIRDIPRIFVPEGPCNLRGSNKAASHVEVFPGESFDYYVHLLNSGAEPCTGVSVTDSVDPRVDVVSCNRGCTVSADGRTVTWDIGTVGPGSSLTLSITVRVKADATGTLENTAIIRSNENPDLSRSVTGPLISDRSVLAPLSPAGPAEVLSRTGPATLPWLVASALGVFALGLRRLRRRVSAA